MFEAIRKGAKVERAKAIAGEKAAERVAKWNIDYTAITPFERQVRKWAIPFYTFMRKATPLMLEGMAIRPGKFVHYDMAKRALEKALGVPEDDQVVWPFWAEQAGKVRLQGGDEPFFMKDPAPLNVVNRLLGGDSPKDPLSNVINQASPLLKMPVEVATGQTLFNQQPIEDWGDYYLSQIPTASIGARAAGAQLTPTETQTPDRSGLEQVSNLLGVPIQRMTYNRQRGEIYRRMGNEDQFVSQFNKALAGEFSIRKVTSKTKGKYFSLKDEQKGEIIGRYRDFNILAREVTQMARQRGLEGA
jgi:hypothetical protein